MNKNHFKLFSYNIPVYGKEKSAIYNLQDGRLYTIPRRYYGAIAYRDENALEESLKKSFLRELQAKGLGFFTDAPENFPEMDLDFSSNSVIESAVLSFSDHYDISGTLMQLDELRCKFIEIRFENIDKLSIDHLSFLDITNNGSPRSINLVFNYHPKYDAKFFAECFLRYPKVRNLLFMGAPQPSNCHQAEHSKVFFIEKNFRQINTAELLPFQPQTIINKDFFIRAKHVNAYYYGKICVSSNGSIKNNLQHENHFGKIQDHSLQQVLQEGGIRELWHIAPDMIDGVKDSHLRYGTIITGRPVKKRDNLYRFSY